MAKDPSGRPWGGQDHISKPEKPHLLQLGEKSLGALPLGTGYCHHISSGIQRVLVHPLERLLEDSFIIRYDEQDDTIVVRIR
eukprot:CAMPEP_0113945370 /NCGR_PEP_ID=MMETSP1339-20121228/44935_1 /TAXON_ID=94617 /ORGANISM="Fibrocapsa japonica" /LENGTH=81 /DNA_ID=CAMNT_0000950927 /DNA_START=202 /DNA_END=444 /DNA_ORIENTATION=- /assembly_acc=CAM_ASM_000762